MRKDRISKYQVTVERHYTDDILVRVNCQISYDGKRKYNRQDHFVYADDLDDLLNALEKAKPEIEFLRNHPRMARKPVEKTKKKPSRDRTRQLPKSS